jgi:hypothetical protein
MIKHFFIFFRFQFSEVLCRMLPRKCYINCRKYNLHIMIEAIKLSHYCRDCIHDKNLQTDGESKSKLKFFLVYSRGLLRLHAHLQLYGEASRAAKANCVCYFSIQFGPFAFVAVACAS